jgi:hypothetical protein
MSKDHQASQEKIEQEFEQQYGEEVAARMHDGGAHQ